MTDHWSGKARHEILLLIMVMAECVVFSRTGHNFATVSNAFEILRLACEIGLLALVMTPVILAGGIDLSVGSLLGFSAVVFGKLWRDVGLAWPIAALLTVAGGGMAGGLNALLITRLRIPALIVTLGTLSLFRGMAEALTRGVDNFTGFPPSFLGLGQGYLAGTIPAQLPVFVAVAAALWLLVHHTRIGREWRAIGFSPEGALHAGVRVDRRVGFSFVLGGLVASLAAVIYVARVGQAKADAGTGYELLAVTAVVLGGTSIRGGSGTIPGTLLGVAALAILRNGLQLSDQPAELAGILTGVLLLAVLVLGKVFKKLSARTASAKTPSVSL